MASPSKFSPPRSETKYYAKPSGSGWSSGNKTGKTAAQKAKERKKANYRGAEGPKKSMPRAGGVGKGGGRGVAANKSTTKKRTR